MGNGCWRLEILHRRMGVKRINVLDMIQYFLWEKRTFFFFLAPFEKKKKKGRVDAGVRSESTQLVEEIDQRTHPPACTSLNTARNFSEWPLPLSLPSSHHCLHRGGVVLKCHRKSRSLSSAPSCSTALVLLLCWKSEEEPQQQLCAILSLPQTLTCWLLKSAP